MVELLKLAEEKRQDNSRYDALKEIGLILGATGIGSSAVAQTHVHKYNKLKNYIDNEFANIRKHHEEHIEPIGDKIEKLKRQIGEVERDQHHINSSINGVYESFDYIKKIKGLAGARIWKHKQLKKLYPKQREVNQTLNQLREELIKRREDADTKIRPLQKKYNKLSQELARKFNIELPFVDLSMFHNPNNIGEALTTLNTLAKYDIEFKKKPIKNIRNIGAGAGALGLLTAATAHYLDKKQQDN